MIQAGLGLSADGLTQGYANAQQFLGTVPGQGTRFSDNSVIEALREFVLKLWNVHSFFVTYANIDGWTPAAPRPSFSERSDMDRYILAELNETVRAVWKPMHRFQFSVSQNAAELDAFLHRHDIHF